MANKKPKNTWPDGKSGNPKGRPKADPALKEFQKISSAELVECLTEYCNFTQEEITEIRADPKTPMFRLLCARILDDAVSAKDPGNARTILLDRLCGRVAVSVDTNAQPGDNRPQVVINLPAKE